jgi:hypothetical protein
MNKQKDVLCPRETLCAAKKEYMFLVPSFWDILFFCLFQFFKELEKE